MYEVATSAYRHSPSAPLMRESFEHKIDTTFERNARKHETTPQIVIQLGSTLNY